jgi:lincosamide nucleotidyltransferase A/C/D/E
MISTVMEKEDVLALNDSLSGDGLDWCLCGGWGVDALLGTQMRPHNDLDVFIVRISRPS